MTAEALASLMNARRVGPGKWSAKCPAHRDRSPSLAISKGADDRVLVHCHAGCTTEAILASLSLRAADLFTGPPPTRERLRQAVDQHAERESEARERRIAHGRVCDQIHQLERVAESLGAKLMQRPEDDALAELFHHCVDKIHRADVIERGLRQ